MRADMGGESRTQSAMRKRVTHRHVPVYVLPKDIMRTATATPTTVSRNPYNMLRTFLPRDSNLPGLVSPRKNNSPIKTAYPTDAFFFFRDAKRSRDSRLAKSACNQIILNFAIKIFYLEYSANICKFISESYELFLCIGFLFYSLLIL